MLGAVYPPLLSPPPQTPTGWYKTWREEKMEETAFDDVVNDLRN